MPSLELKLVKAIEKRPLLYKRSFASKMYKDVREKLWLEVAAEVFGDGLWLNWKKSTRTMAVNSLKQKWVKMRNAYNRGRNSNVTGGPSTSFHTLLSFLDADNDLQSTTTSVQVQQHECQDTDSRHEVKNSTISKATSDTMDFLSSLLSYTNHSSFFQQLNTTDDNKNDENNNDNNDNRNNETTNLTVSTNGDREFLLSLLPYMEHVNDTFKVRMELMSVIRNNLQHS